MGYEIRKHLSMEYGNEVRITLKVYIDTSFIPLFEFYSPVSPPNWFERKFLKRTIESKAESELKHLYGEAMEFIEYHKKRQAQFDSLERLVNDYDLHD
jgi:hypothetical protein